MPKIMPVQIKTIGLLGVNCYLVTIGDGFILIDTGFSFKRRTIERELENAGCRPGNLKLIIITHGDSDHTGNAAYLREKYGTKIAMHPVEAAVTEMGNMALSRKLRKKLIRIIARVVFRLPVARLSKSDRFKPDVYVEDGYDLSGYGFEARTLGIPGHSNGSIGILATEGDLFCGDLLVGGRMPVFNSNMDDVEAGRASVEKLMSLPVQTVYPGHGEPFPMEEFIKNYR